MMDVGRDLERMQDYVSGRLPDDEHRAFEERLMRDPDLVREFEQSLRLREGLELLRERGHFVKPPVRSPRAWTWLPALAAAAILALVMFLWVQPGRPPGGVSQSLPGTLLAAAGGSPVTAHFTFVATRDDSTPTLALPASGLIELRAAPAERSAQSDYRVTLVREDDGGSPRPVGTVSNVALTADGYVHAYAEASHLAPGTYALRVAAVSEPKAPPAEFHFRLRAPDSNSAP
jgi:hypothetical protein